MESTALVSKAKIEILGRQYTLRGDVEPEYMVELAQYVNGKLNELKQLAPDTDPMRLSLLMSLNLADELFQARQKPAVDVNSSELSALQERTLHMISMLEEGLIGEDLV